MLIALFGSSNLELFKAPLRARAAELGLGEIEVYVPPFGQWPLLLRDPASPLRAQQYDDVLFMERAEDLFAPLLADPLACPPGDLPAQIEARLAPYLDSLRAAREALPGHFLVLALGSLTPSPLGLADAASPQGHRAILAQANALLAEAVQALPAADLIDLPGLLADFGRAAAHPGKYWHLGRFPFSRDFAAFLTDRLLGALLALMGKTTRLLVLDLDNTLWGGVIGDDGLGGIQLGGDYPGSVFQAFQGWLKALKARGMVLALASKNSEAVAMQALEGHPAMILKPEDFAAQRINWQPKALNIQAMAEELALGLGHICFIDDNPVEREAVRRALPEVLVPELPPDPTAWIVFLSGLPQLTALRLTEADLRRAESYTARAQVERLRRDGGSLEDFYRQLEMQLTLEAYAPANEARTLQLLAKTNQFNTTTRRYNAHDLQRKIAAGSEVFAIWLQDRFAPREQIGVLVLDWHGDTVELDSFLLSCRVLGRGVETAALGWAAERARRRGAATLTGAIIPTERNEPVRGLYADHGFASAGDGVYCLRLGGAALAIPPWFTVHTAE